MPQTPLPDRNAPAESGSEQPLDIHTSTLIEIWERKLTRRLESLREKNENAQQDREIDIDLAPLYLEVLNRKQQAPRFGHASPEARIARLHSPFDLYEYVKQLYIAHTGSGSPWPMRFRAAVLSISTAHDVPYDVYADERGSRY